MKTIVRVLIATRVSDIYHGLMAFEECTHIDTLLMLMKLSKKNYWIGSDPIQSEDVYIFLAGEEDEHKKKKRNSEKLTKNWFTTSEMMSEQKTENKFQELVSIETKKKKRKIVLRSRNVW